MTRVKRSRLVRDVKVLLVAGSLMGCDASAPVAEQDPEARPDFILQVEPAGSTEFRGIVGAAIADGPAIHAFRDANRRPVEGVRVLFTRLPGDFPVGEAKTDANGIARLTPFTLDTIPRSYWIRARTDGAPAIDFVVRTIAGPIEKLNIISGDGQRGQRGRPLRFLLRVSAVDAYNNIVAVGTPVTFSISSGGGNVTDAVDSTDVLGMASSGHWTLGSDGPQEVTVRGGNAEAVFRASLCEDDDVCLSNLELAFERNGNIYVSNLASPDPALLLTAAQYPVWSPNGSQLAFVRYSYGSSEICITDADGNAIRCTANQLPGTALRPTWSPDGRQIMTSSGVCGALDCSYKTILITTDAMEWTIVDTPSLLSVSWSPDGTKIAFVLGSEGLGIMNPDGSAFEVLAKRFDSFLPTAVAWAPDGQHLAVSLYDESMCPFFCWMALGVTDSRATTLSVIPGTHEYAGVQDPAWSPDGRITYARDSRDIYSISPSGANAELVMRGASAPSWRSLH
ncbi:MAG TPA: hypothetical protein VF042_00360 [Gemmatimonadaceae bacterium]